MAAKINRIFFVILFTLFTIFSAFAQTPDFQTVKSADGLIFVNNNKVQRFSFFVAGKNPTERQNEDGSFLLETEDGGVYAYFVKTSEFLDPKKPVDRANILEAQRDRDVEMEEKTQQTKLNVTKGADFISIKDVTNPLFPEKVVPSIFWHYSPDGELVVLYQSVLIGETVLMLRIVFPKTIEVEKPRGFLRNILKSVMLLPSAPTTKKQPIRKNARRKN